MYHFDTSTFWGGHHRRTSLPNHKSLTYSTHKVELMMLMGGLHSYSRYTSDYPSYCTICSEGAV